MPSSPTPLYRLLTVAGHHARGFPSGPVVGVSRVLVLVVAFFVAFPANAACYRWPLRLGGDGRPSYDADTIRISMPGLPPELSAVSVRLRGVDAPEIKGKCPRERKAATAARDYVSGVLLEARSVEFCDPTWEKYGRVLATVKVDGRDLAETLTTKRLARAYDGGTRAGWCNP